MITTAVSGWTLRISSRSCKPSIPGIFRSTRAIDQRPALAFSSADGPSSATSTRWPSSRSHPDSDSRTISSSSTTRIRVRSLLIGAPGVIALVEITGPAVAAESSALGVDLEQTGRPGHHTLTNTAVDEAEGVPELVRGLFEQGRRERA